jgi:hypothetical protein
MNLRLAWRSLFVFIAAAVFASVVACGGSSTAPGDDAGHCMPVEPPTTCPSPPPSYKTEISAIVATHCSEGTKCHSQGGAESVKDFTTYQGLAADHLTVEYEVAQCPSSPMPPPGYLPLTAAQRFDLVAWAGICRAPNN